MESIISHNFVKNFQFEVVFVPLNNLSVLCMFSVHGWILDEIIIRDSAWNYVNTPKFLGAVSFVLQLTARPQHLPPAPAPIDLLPC